MVLQLKLRKSRSLPNLLYTRPLHFLSSFFLLYPPCPRLILEGSFFLYTSTFSSCFLLIIMLGAMLGKVLDEVDLLQQVISSQDQSIKNISKALTDMVGRIDGLEKHTQKGNLRKGYTIKDDIKKAVRKLVKAKLEGKSLSDIDMVDLTPAQQELVKSFSGAKSVRQIKNAILQYTNAVGTVARNQKFAKQKPIALKEDILKTQRLHQEQVALADEMNELDRTNEEYTGETININGKERSVYNSEGNRIAKSEQALRAFYNWFGDSKVLIAKADLLSFIIFTDKFLLY